MQRILFLFVIFAYSCLFAPAQSVIPEILKRVDAHQKALRSLQADIKIIKSAESHTKEGIVKFLPNTKGYLLRIDTTKPSPEIFSIVKKQYLFYTTTPSLFYLPDVKTAYTGTVTDSQKNIFMILSIPSRSELEKDYTIAYTGQENVGGAIPAWHLVLKPKTVKNYKIIEFWIDGSGMVIQSKATENNGDWTTVLLSNTRKNLPVKATNFIINLPKETKIVRN